MLPTELLMFRIKGGVVEPKILKPNPTNLALAAQLIQMFESHLNNKRFELDEDLKALEVGRQDYRVIRGLAHLLTSGHSTFETGGDLAPPLARARVFELAQSHPPARHRRQEVLEQAARSLNTDPETLADALYADLADQQRLTSFEGGKTRF